MRIASYNIMSGGFNCYNHNSSVPERIELIKKAVSQINADFIALLDTFRWDSIYTPQDLQNMFQYPHVYCINLEDERLKQLGHNNGITILSRVPIYKFETISLQTRNAIKSSIKLETGQTLDIFTIYLDDLSEDARIVQIQTLFQYINRLNPTIIMGDFNSFTPRDLPQIREKLKEFFIKNDNFKEKLEEVFDGMMQCRVINMVRVLNFIDTDAFRRYKTFPTKLFPANIDNPFLKIDYIFVNSKIMVQNFFVPEGKIFEETSDHLPVVMDFSCKIKSA